MVSLSLCLRISGPVQFSLANFICVCLDVRIKLCRTQTWDLALKTNQCHDESGVWGNWHQTAGAVFVLYDRTSSSFWKIISILHAALQCSEEVFHQGLMAAVFKLNSVKVNPVCDDTATLLHVREMAHTWGLVKDNQSVFYHQSYFGASRCRIWTNRLSDRVVERLIGGHWYASY